MGNRKETEKRVGDSMNEHKRRNLPGGWRWEKLGGNKGVAEIINGSTPTTNNPEYWDGDILWATPSDLGKLNSIYIDDTERRITKAGLDSCSATLLSVGTVLLTSRAPVGNLAITKKPICTNQGFKSFIPKEEIDSLYLYFAIRKIVPGIQKQSHGNTFTEITKELVQNFEIPISPSLDGQIRIATELERKMAEIEKMRQAADNQLEAIGALSGAILRVAFDFEEEEAS
jgi:type I restriction enzyme S subunit